MLKSVECAECDGYSVELECLQAQLALCGNSLACRMAIERRMDSVFRKGVQNCAECTRQQPPISSGHSAVISVGAGGEISAS